MIHRFCLFTPRVKQLSLRMSKKKTDGGTIDDKNLIQLLHQKQSIGTDSTVILAMKIQYETREA